MEISSYIKKELIKLNLPCKSRNELFQMMHQEAYKYGYVKEDFLQGLLSREEVFPTGIKLSNYSVAIPHTEAEYVNNQFISVVVPERPIYFKQMDDETIETEVSLIFMLGLNKPHSQLEALKELMNLIQQEEVINKIISAKNEEEVIKLLDTIN
ncbi:PTS sugar transporter subunit IIA [Clostridium folliculivorans]|uniref:PTS fructose transporter subunit IIA n=1 Tax=Clostridium folliculivorans TaxID=2886038 RepID=A0A9W5Y2L6_9CLOT|nr:PTS sugar transporter subunit IIA [Clostridium folliculivorans]GKU25435.1 PTS fructose transporter subunit IIA [Clostridium folliculivorans]GKU28457.1 PTS fructose transporter subunit IIA [Clostridium folliculivorans]